MILVTAAYGNQGRVLIPLLAKAGLPVRVTPGREQELLDLGAKEALTGSAADRDFVRRAIEGVETVYHIGPSAHPLEREMGMTMVDVAAEVGIGLSRPGFAGGRFV